MENVKTGNCITREELKQLIATTQQQVKIIDVRNKEEYDECHVPGAINIIISEIKPVDLAFNKTDILITVCGKGGGRSMQASEKLRDAGFKNSAWLCGGTFGWTSMETKV